LRAAPLPSSNKCAVIEVMGRDMGYLTVRAGDMRPGTDTTGAEENKMSMVAPTIVMAVPEWSVDEKGHIVVSLSDIVAAVRERMTKYGAATVLVSEGFRMSKGDPLLQKVLDANPLLKVRFSRVKTDVQGNLILNELGISDFVTEALELELPGLVGPKDVYREVFGYAIRSRVPDEIDRAIAEDATTKAAALITEDAQRRAVILQGGVCVSADIGLTDIEDAKTKVEPLAAVQGKVDLKDSGLYTLDELRAINVLGPAKPADNLVELPATPTLTHPSGKNIELAITAVNSMSESARDMNRVNLCVFPGESGDMLVSAVNPANRKPISKADEYVTARVDKATVYIDSAQALSLTDILKRAYEIYDTHKFFSLVISGNFVVSAQDALMEVLKKDPVASAIIDKAETDSAGGLIFGRKIVDLLAAALGNEEAVKAAGIEPKKLMSGIRKNVMDQSLNLIPGEGRKDDAVTEIKTETVDAAIAHVRQLTGILNRHLDLNSQGKFDMQKLVVIMKKDLPESIIGRKKGTLNDKIKKEFQVMKQHLRKVFPGGVIEVGSREEMVLNMNARIAQGLKVIVLDEGTLTKGFDTSAVSGKATEDYCFITANRIDNIDELSVPFVNLNAMAIMGIGIIYNDKTLFEMAYRVFTGNDVPPNVIEDLAKNALWLVRMLPRIVRFKDDLADQEKLARLVEVAA
ncbi:MAG: hypothetical protein JW919_05335, partial [Candidatus Omnitrophica bacterium]|nr:hypothetical protein [Candidatus Omnitrophota bacterium]